MIDLDKIHSLSDFQRNAKKYLRRLKKTGRPEVLTVNGQAEVIVQSAAGYQELLETAELAETLPILKKSLDEARLGQNIPATAVLAEMRRKLGIKE